MPQTHLNRVLVGLTSLVAAACGDFDDGQNFAASEQDASVGDTTQWTPAESVADPSTDPPPDGGGGQRRPHGR